MNIHPEITPSKIAHEPAAASDIADTSAWFDMSKAQGVFIHVVHYRGGDTDFVVSVHQGTAESGTSEMTTTFPIWYASDCLTDPTLSRQTDAATFTIDTGVYTGTQDLWIYVDGSKLTDAYRYIQAGTAGGHGSSIAMIEYLPVGLRYQGNEAL